MNSSYAPDGKNSVIIGGPYSHFTRLDPDGHQLTAAMEAQLDFHVTNWPKEPEDIEDWAKQLGYHLKEACQEAGATIIIQPWHMRHGPFLQIGIGLSESDASLLVDLETGHSYLTAQTCAGISPREIGDYFVQSVQRTNHEGGFFDHGQMTILSQTNYCRGEIRRDASGLNKEHLNFVPAARDVTQPVECRRSTITQLTADVWGPRILDSSKIMDCLKRSSPVLEHFEAAKPNTEPDHERRFDFHDEVGNPAGTSVLVMVKGTCTGGTPLSGILSAHTFPYAEIIGRDGQVMKGLVTWTMALAGLPDSDYQSHIHIAKTRLATPETFGLRPRDPFECHQRTYWRGLAPR